MGTGSGILAFFAAQAGARRVYAVEASGVGELEKSGKNPCVVGSMDQGYCNCCCMHAPLSVCRVLQDCASSAA